MKLFVLTFLGNTVVITYRYALCTKSLLGKALNHNGFMTFGSIEDISHQHFLRLGPTYKDDAVNMLEAYDMQNDYVILIRHIRNLFTALKFLCPKYCDKYLEKFR